MNNIRFDANLLIKTVKEFETHWVGKFLAQIYVGVYRGKKKMVDWSLFIKLDDANKEVFYQILNMRNGWPYTDEQLYQVEKTVMRIMKLKH
jgi:hypothetical protein